MRRTSVSLSAEAPAVKAPVSLQAELRPVLFDYFQKKSKKAQLAKKYALSNPNPVALNAYDGFYVFAQRNVETKQAKYWTPPSLKPDNVYSNLTSAESVSVDAYFKQTIGDSSFMSTPFWFRLKNRRDFYTYDEFLAVLLTESYWESTLVKILNYPNSPLKARKGWSKWSTLSAVPKSVSGSSVSAEDLAKAKKNNQVYLVSSDADKQLLGLKRPFRQRFFAVFRALTNDYNGEQFAQEWVQDRVAELKTGLKLWLDPSLLLQHGTPVPSDPKDLKAYFPPGKLTRSGFQPSSLEFLSFGGLFQYQFPLPYNLHGVLQVHPNVKRFLQENHFLDLSNSSSVFHTHASWHPLNEKRVGSAGAGYAVDKAQGASGDAKSQVVYPGTESELRVASINAIIFAFWSYTLRRTYFHTRASSSSTDLSVTDAGLPLYRRRDDVPFGNIRVKLFKKRTWKQLHPTTDSTAVSKIWALRPRQKFLELSEDLLSASNSFESYFTNVDRPVSEFSSTVVKI